MLLSLIKNQRFARRAYLRFGEWWVRRKLRTVVPHLPEGDILDIGSGNGMVTAHLRRRGHSVTPLDVAPLSILPDVETVVYDGMRMPFRANGFAAGLLLTVLHHTDDPEAVLWEAGRICRRLVIIEDIYKNMPQKYLTYAMDTLVNLGHSNMTYQNKDDQGWRAAFRRMGMRLISAEEKRVLLFFRQVTYVLECP